MKITRSLKQKISFVAFQVVTGQLSDLDALADMLDAIVFEARKQSEAR